MRTAGLPTSQSQPAQAGPVGPLPETVSLQTVLPARLWCVAPGRARRDEVRGRCFRGSPHHRRHLESLIPPTQVVRNKSHFGQSARHPGAGLRWISRYATGGLPVGQSDRVKRNRVTAARCTHREGGILGRGSCGPPPHRLRYWRVRRELGNEPTQTGTSGSRNEE